MDKPGSQFEKAVAAFLSKLDPNARVEHDIKVPDRRTGTPRQVDVMITATVCGHPVRIACSCKDWQSKLDIGDIDAFCGEMDAVNVRTGILYSRAGFTQPAIDAAKKVGISCCRLYQNEPADIPEVIFLPTYCSVPRYQMISAGDLEGWGFRTWNDVFDHKPRNSLASIGQHLANEIFRLHKPEKVDRLLRDKARASFDLNDPGGKRPPIRFGVLCEWDHYKGQVEAHIMSGSYSLTSKEFKGSQHGPAVDMHEPPGPGWVPLSSEECASVDLGMCATVYHGADGFLEQLKEIVGPRPVRPQVQTMQQIGEHIIASLRQMDAEADTQRNGHPTGLSWYAAHSRPDLKKPRTEPEWSKRLAVLLNERGIPATNECRYPTSGLRQKCDVVISLLDGGRVWLEVKGAWKHWWLQRGGEWFYRSYLFHPLLPGLDKSKTHTAALDLQKLSAITRAHGTHIGLLLIGFDGVIPMEPDVQEFVRLAKLDDGAWQMSNDWWPDPRRPGQFVRCWLWVREIPSVCSA